MADESESKVVFREGADIRVLRGVITGEDDFFLRLKRRNATFRISKAIILKISQPREENR